MNNSSKKSDKNINAQKVKVNMQNVVIERFIFIISSAVFLWLGLKLIEYNYNGIKTINLMPNIMLAIGIIFLIITGIIYVMCFKQKRLNQGIPYIVLCFFITIYGFFMWMIKMGFPKFKYQFAGLFLYLIIGCAYSAFKYYIITYKRK